MNLAGIHEEMSKLLNKQVDVQNESLFRESCKLPQAHKKCVMKMKEEKEKKKQQLYKNFCGERKDFIRPYQKNG